MGRSRLGGTKSSSPGSGAEDGCLEDDGEGFWLNWTLLDATVFGALGVDFALLALLVVLV